jgi:ATP/maltotriose-dependent transcriptional regulator MalT
MPLDSRERGIDWNTARSEEKLQFFYGWCANLESRINTATAEINSLQRRLDEVEKKP